MPRDLADLVAVHLVAAERALGEEDPDLAYEHAKVARRFGSRVGVVREAAGVAAYRAGHFAEALNDLRAARRLTGSDELLPLLADCERGLGRPERAIDLVRSPEAERAGRAVQIELAIVESGARRDLGQKDAAIVTLQRLPELRDARPRPWSARLAFAYADALADAGHNEAATDWFSRAMTFDEDGETDAAERYAELTGADIEDIQDIEEDVEHLDADADAGDGDGDAGSQDEDELDSESAEAGDDVLVEAEDAQPAADAEGLPDEKPEAGSEQKAGETPGSQGGFGGGSADDESVAGDAREADPGEEAARSGTADESVAAASKPDADEPADLELDEEVRAKSESGDVNGGDEDGAADETDAGNPAVGPDEGKSGGTAGTDVGAASATGGAIGLGPAFIEPDFGGDDARGSAEPGTREA